MENNADRINYVDTDLSKLTSLKLFWKIDTDNYTGDPLYHNGILFINAMEDLEHTGELVAIDSLSGQKTYVYDVDGNMVTPHCIYDEMLILSGNDGLTAIEKGVKKWSLKGIAGHFPVVYKDILIANNFNYIFFANPLNGNLIKKIDTGVPSSVACSEGKVIFTEKNLLSNERKLSVIDIKTLDLSSSSLLEIYDKDNTPYPVTSPYPVIAERKIFIIFKIYLVCLNFETGNILWKTKCRARQVICIDRKVYCFDEFCFMCLDSNTGKILYRKEHETKELIPSLPLIAGKFFFITNEQGIHAYDITSGDKIWNYIFKPEDIMDEKARWYLPRPIFAEGRLFAGGFGKMYCFGIE